MRAGVRVVDAATAVAAPAGSLEEEGVVEGVCCCCCCSPPKRRSRCSNRCSRTRCASPSASAPTAAVVVEEEGASVPPPGTPPSVAVTSTPPFSPLSLLALSSLSLLASAVCASNLACTSGAMYPGCNYGGNLCHRPSSLSLCLLSNSLSSSGNTDARHVGHACCLSNHDLKQCK